MGCFIFYFEKTEKANVKVGEIWIKKDEQDSSVSPVIIDAIKDDWIYFWEIFEDGILSGHGSYGEEAFSTHREGFLRRYYKKWDEKL